MKSNWAYLVAPFFGWLIAQAVKNILRAPRKHHGKVAKYFTSGEMPSAHTATVIALLTVIFIRQGASDLFAVAAVFSAVTIYDALVARRSIGEQGEAIIEMMKDMKVRGVSKPRVALGHKPLEVLVGLLIGIGVGVTVAIFITF